MRSLILYLALTGAVLADEPMNAASFQAYTQGKIFEFAYDDEPPYGTEQYLPDRQVIWIDFEGACWRGKWFEQDGHICFRYRNMTGLTCSMFYVDGDAMIVVPDDSMAAVHRAVPAQSLPSNRCEAPLS